MTSDELRRLADQMGIYQGDEAVWEDVAGRLMKAADEIDRLQSDRQALIDELFRVRDLITGQEDYDIVTQLLKDMGENAGGDE